MPPVSDSKPSSTLMRLALAGAVLLAAAGLAAFWWASGARQAAGKADDGALTVTIRDKVCEPNEITVPAGRTTFRIVNASQRVLEWEILDGVMVVEERENIAPGFSQSMTVKLESGDYDITCGLLSNPRGKLHVTPSVASQAEAARPSLVNYIGPLAEYRVYVTLQAADVHEAAGALARAVAGGDLAQARAAYLAAHEAYGHVEPMAEMFSDLDTRLNVRPEYLEGREGDPAFGGFFRIEQGLLRAGSLDGLEPVASRLAGDADALRQRLRTLDITPERLSAAPARLLRRVAGHVATDAGRDPAAERSQIQGQLEGTRTIARLLSPLLAKAAPDLRQRIEQDYERAGQALADDGRDGAVSDAGRREALAAAVQSLAGDFEKINTALGLD